MEYLQILSNNRLRAKEMGLRGRERAETVYSWRSVIAQYEALWSELLSDGKRYQQPTLARQLGFMDYDKIFAEYSKNHISLDSTVHLGEGIEDIVALLHGGQLFSPSPLAGFSDALDLRILEAMRHMPTIRLRELIEALADRHHGQSMAATQISRLAKYGVLTILPPLNALTNTQELAD